MKKLNLLLLLFALIGVQAHSEEKLTVQLEADQVATINDPEFLESSSKIFSLSIDEMPEGLNKYNPYIYYGLNEADSGNSFRLFITQSQPNEKLIAGVELIKNGKHEIRKALLIGIPLKAKIEFMLSWNKSGLVTYRIMDGPVNTLQTGLEDFTGIIHMSNATATYYPKIRK